jgi:hypothetical protein
VDNPYQPPQQPDFTPTTPTSGATRPTILTVFGILNIVFGSFGLLCTPVSALALFIPQPAMPNGQVNPALAAMQDPGYRTFMIFSLVMGMIAAACLLAAGIGLLKQRSWGRTISIGYAGYSLVMVVIGLIISYTYIVSPLMAKAQQNNDPTIQAGAVGGAFGGMAGGCAGAIYPVLLLIFMNQKSVKGALGAKGDSADPWVGSSA